MNREEFILALRKELKKLPPEEIVAATEFYQEYFDEACGDIEDPAEREKAEKELVGQLGNYKTIAAQIKGDYAARILDGEEEYLGEKPGKKKKISAVLWVILGICSAPVTLPIIFAVLAVVVAVLVGIACGIIGCFAAGIGSLVIGILAVPTAVATAVAFIGCGLMGLAVSAAAAVGLVWLIKIIVKALAKSYRERSARKREADEAAGQWHYKGGEGNE